jgi:glucosyl-3-phosphoglycerate synthase
MAVATFHHGAFRADDLVARKQGRTIGVVIPAHNEASTIAAIVTTIRRSLMGRAGLVDELIVVDDGSDDHTGAIAIAAGADVCVPAASSPGHGVGKGGALAAGVCRAGGDIVVFLDADVTDFGAHYVTGLVGPLLRDPKLVMTKATYRRDCHGVEDEGGRVTQLVARPLLARGWPSLAGFTQPLAGECAITRPALDPITLADGYVVEIAMLLDIAAIYSADAIAQVDLDHRSHRNRPLTALADQATEILAAVLDRPVEHPSPCADAGFLASASWPTTNGWRNAFATCSPRTRT